MSRAAAKVPFETLADVLKHLGDVAPSRVRMKPPPGKATEKDVTRLETRTGRLFELIDATLVEKVMGYLEAALALRLGRLLDEFSEEHDLGIVAGADGTVRLMPGLVRIPDLSFTAWDRLPVRGELPTQPIPDLVPDLAVEVLSEGNTPGEMARKLKDFFFAGVRLVWFVDPKRRTVEVFTSPDESRTFAEGETLDGSDVLPGLVLPVRQVFARLPGTKAKPKGGKRPKGRG